MKTSLRVIWLSLAISVITIGFSYVTSLKDAYKNHFKVGVAINGRQASGNDTRAEALIEQQFNALSPENDMKWGPIHPQRDSYNFEPADRYVALGLKYNIFIVGHTLIWHQQTPAWVFTSDNGNARTRDELLKVMQDHISNVVGRYKGKVKGWDVVNEAFNDDGTFRKTKWLEIIGEDFIEKAFEFAHAADPEAELYYNDYNLFFPKKCQAAIKLVNRLKAKNIPITAVGEQGHYGLKRPELNQIERTIIALSQSGVKVNITELDVNVLPDRNNQPTADISNTAAYNDKFNPYVGGLPDSVSQKLAQRYSSLFSLFSKHQDKITRVTFWGLTDGDSWLNNFPIRGRTNYPLLFGRDHQPKQKVYEAVINAAK